ncbi:MAG: DMT family transporter [Pseudomonadales bacterium]|nr:DMT family transporter [Pseudomonadales bacterium]
MSKVVIANTLLLITAAIWGFGFVAQVMGMNYLDPYAFIGLRFLLGAVSLIPVIYFVHKRMPFEVTNKRELWLGCAVLGVILFIAGSLQQVGLLYTTASNAGFITGTYMVIVPILGLILKYQTGVNTWLGCFLAAFGLYLLSVKEGLTMGYGDGLQLLGAVFWAAHIMAIDHFIKRSPALLLAFGQFLMCGILALCVSSVLETTTFEAVANAVNVLIYAGIITVGVAYTLQVVAQNDTKPTHAAIILSLEAVFGAVGGALLLDEALSQREMLGCAIMLCGMIVSQVTWSDLVGPKEDNSSQNQA